MSFRAFIALEGFPDPDEDTELAQGTRQGKAAGCLRPFGPLWASLRPLLVDGPGRPSLRNAAFSQWEGRAEPGSSGAIQQHLGLGGVVTAESWLGSFCWLRLWLHGVEGGGIGGPAPLTSRSQTCLLACAPWPLQVSGRGEK